MNLDPRADRPDADTAPQPRAGASRGPRVRHDTPP